jgi:hypothetical protein
MVVRAFDLTTCSLRAGTTLLIGAALGALACSPEAGKPKGPPDGAFTVSEYFAPSGAMGDGATVGNLVINDNKGCKDRPEGAVGNCYAFDYTAGPMLWAGLYWQYPANNWGAEAGLPVHGEKFTKITFQAAVKEVIAPATSEKIIFVVGGIGVPRLPEEAEVYPHNDQMKHEMPFDVTTEWQQFELPIPAQFADDTTPITELIGAFAWYINHPPDTDPATAPLKTVYIDDLAYE